MSSFVNPREICHKINSNIVGHNFLKESDYTNKAFNSNLIKLYSVNNNIWNETNKP